MGQVQVSLLLAVCVAASRCEKSKETHRGGCGAPSAASLLAPPDAAVASRRERKKGHSSSSSGSLCWASGQNTYAPLSLSRVAQFSCALSPMQTQSTHTHTIYLLAPVYKPCTRSLYTLADCPYSALARNHDVKATNSINFPATSRKYPIIGKTWCCR